MTGINRRIDQLHTELTREKNRRHAPNSPGASAEAIATTRGQYSSLERRIARKQESGLQLVRRVPALVPSSPIWFRPKALAKSSAMRCWRALGTPDDSPLAVVAMAGLDPRPTSRVPRSIGRGASQSRQPSPARRLSHAALVAIQHEPNVKAFYNNRYRWEEAECRPSLRLAQTAARHLGMLKHDQDFDGNKFFRTAMKNTYRKESI